MLGAKRNVSLHSTAEAVWSSLASFVWVCGESMLCCLHDIDRAAHTYPPTATPQSLSPSGCGSRLDMYGTSAGCAHHAPV